MTREFLLNALSNVMVKSGYGLSEAQTNLAKSTTAELHEHFYRAIRAGTILPDGSLPPGASASRAPTVSDADVVAARAQGEAELEALREQHRERLSARRAERMADAILFQRQQYLDQEPQRAAQLQKDKQTFVEAYDRIRNFGNNEANWNVVSSTLGPGFTVYDLEQALSRNAIQLSAPNQAEIDEWASQDISRRNAELKAMSIPDLKKEMVREQQQRAITAHEEESNRVLAAQQEADSYAGYPPMPLVNSDGVKLDSLFFRRASAATIRLYIRRYGNSQITDAIRNRN